MSECITRVEKIKTIEPHLNAEKLEIAIIRGWHCVVPKGVYSSGDLCVYIPIDSVIPEQLKETLFEGSKVDLPKNRIKTIRLRGVYSQGLVANLEVIKQYLGNHGKHEKLEEGLDITELLQITKFEPKAPAFQQFKSSTIIKDQNLNFYKYKGMENYKNYVGLFEPEDYIVATEKIHGTNFRAGWVKKEPAKDLWTKIKRFLTTEYEFVVGSHNVQIKEDGNNIYSEMAKRLNLKQKLRKGEILYGEIFGPNVQKGYHYELADGQTDFVSFDIRKEDKEWLDYLSFYERVMEMKIKPAPILFQGEFKDLNIDELVLGNSILAPLQKVREGIVIRSTEESKEKTTKNGRKVLKCISPEYLMGKNNTDYH